MKILVTGAAGFIGFHTSNKLIENGHSVIGVDNLNDYYDVNLKRDRLKGLEGNKHFIFEKTDISELLELRKVFIKHEPDIVINLAAQAGVRYSLINPFIYQQVNGQGFLNIIELSKEFKVKKFLYASSSSVYGGNKKIPFSEKDPVEQPLSLYASTKRSNELTAYTYNNLYDLNVCGFRFFTVYGPWGRPDMALFLFTKAILDEEPIRVFNHGKMKRDFTYIDDIVAGVCAAVEKDNLSKVYNLGNHRQVELLYFIECIEKSLGKEAIKEFMPLQDGDVPDTYADIELAQSELGFEPKTVIEEGINRFIVWYTSYYNY
ncbi:MAG: NAD-dependent epimerase/dehydratase family protein [Nitrospinae bacterium]|nr:NAD-dependent epimerase/dehydratase family protein [Nitrospinota bacterium]